MGPGAGNAEGGGCHGGDELPDSPVQVLHVESEVVFVGGVFVSTTSRLGTPA